jgi:hypothetical protein
MSGGGGDSNKLWPRWLTEGDVQAAREELERQHRVVEYKVQVDAMLKSRRQHLR